MPSRDSNTVNTGSFGVSHLSDMPVTVWFAMTLIVAFVVLVLLRLFFHAHVDVGASA